MKGNEDGNGRIMTMQKDWLEGEEEEEMGLFFKAFLVSIGRCQWA